MSKEVKIKEIRVKAECPECGKDVYIFEQPQIEPQIDNVKTYEKVCWRCKKVINFAVSAFRKTANE